MRDLTLNFPSIFLVLIIVISCVSHVAADPDVYITVETNEQTYFAGEVVTIFGNLTQDETQVTDALIGIQVNDAQDNTVSIRTRSTGTTPSSWSITITELISCDQSGNPKDAFIKGTFAYFKVTVKNLNTISERFVRVTINLYDSTQVSFGIAWIGTTVGPNKEFTYLTSIPIPSEASTGAAYAFANAYNKWPKENGIAYCGEEFVNFTITDGASSSSSNGYVNSQSLSSEGTYELTFRLRSKPGLGDHTVYASYYQTLATTTFDVVWLFTDIDRNGEVDIFDIASVAKAYGAEPSHQNWNPKLDLDGSGLVDIFDIAKVAKDFGKKRV